jgi:hypothetical protein
MKFKKIVLDEKKREFLMLKLNMNSRINPANGCQEWIAGNGSKGYGSTTICGKSFLAHRASWIVFKGEIPDGKLVCHSCDNPKCIRVEHLFLGSHSDNSDDKMAKGRWKPRKRTPEEISKKEENSRRAQLAFDVNEELHTEIKILAARRNISMNMWLNRAIQERIKKEHQYKEDEK